MILAAWRRYVPARATRFLQRTPRRSPEPRDGMLVDYVDHTVPARVSPGIPVDASVRITNRSTEVWGHRGEEPAVDLIVHFDGKLATVQLPGSGIAPGTSVDVPFSIVACEPGTVELKIDLVRQGVSRFEALGNQPLVLLVDVAPPVSDSEHVARAGAAPALPVYGVRYGVVDVPRCVSPGARFAGTVELENRGGLVWDAQSRSTNHCTLVGTLDGTSVETWALPHSAYSRERVIVHFAMTAPTVAGVHPLVIEMVHQQVCRFGERGVEPLRVDLHVRDEPADETARLRAISQRRNAWFYQPTHGVSNTRNGTPLPVFLVRGDGCRVWDPAGREYIDYSMGWGSALPGYGHPRIRRAVQESLDWGQLLPMPHPVEMELSETLCENIPCAEMVAFGKNGSDVCTIAVRLARLATGRTKVLTCGYHGWQDWFAEKFGFDGTGVPGPVTPRVYAFRFNDYADFKRVLAAHRDDVAAVIMEPVGPAEGMQGPEQDADPEFLKAVARDTHEAGALLVFDEILTGFRYPELSAQKAFGVLPDLACFGKALGAGFPISALVGRADVFSGAMSRTFYGPTYKGELASLAAARAAVALYQAEPVAEYVSTFGATLQAEINALCMVLGLAASLAGPPYRFGLVFREPDPVKLRLMRTLYQQELLKGGLITYNGVMLPSYAHDAGVMDRTLDVMGAALTKVARAASAGALDQLVELPLLES